MYKKANPNPARNAKGKYPLQSAYYGSNAINNTNGAQKIPPKVVEELKKRVVGTAWWFDNSDSSGTSFKRPINGSDIKPWNFLYKTQGPG